MWESNVDIVNVGVEVNAKSPREVQRLQAHNCAVIHGEHGITTYLRSISWDGVQWDWTRPCYFDTIRYQCEMFNTEDNG